MAELQRPDVSLYELTEMIERDPVLAYRLLRLVNSASFAIPGAVTSIRRALVLIGLDQARRLASVLTLTVISGAAGHLSEQLVVRAKMCELVADTFDVVDLGSAFSAGLFSGLDLLLGMPMDAVVAGLGLSDPVRDALVTRTGALGRLLEAAVAYERGEAGGEIAVWSPAFGEALRWAASLRNELEV
jgi:EAL and modified HD-GYP domain-containing signal transduction protein